MDRQQKRTTQSDSLESAGILTHMVTQYGMPIQHQSVPMITPLVTYPPPQSPPYPTPYTTAYLEMPPLNIKTTGENQTVQWWDPCYGILTMGPHTLALSNSRGQLVRPN